MERQRTARIFVDRSKGSRPSDPAEAARAFARAILPRKDFDRRMDEIRAAIAASRARSPLARILDSHDHQLETRRKDIESQIADLQAQLRELGGSDA